MVETLALAHLIVEAVLLIVYVLELSEQEHVLFPRGVN